MPPKRWFASTGQDKLFVPQVVQGAHIRLSSRIEAFREGLVDPVHQSLKTFAWEVLDRIEQ